MLHVTKKAFTLIELLIVVAIIGILSSIILVNLSVSAKNKTRDAVIMKSVDLMIKVMQNECGSIGDYTKCVTNSSNYSNCVSAPTLWCGFSLDAYVASALATCDDNFNLMFQGDQMRKVCRQIVSTWPDSIESDLSTQAGNIVTSPGRGKAVIRMWLPGKQKFFCKNTDGQVSATRESNGSCPTGCPGCN